MKNLSLLTRKILALCGALVLAFLDQFIKYLVVILISPMNLPQVEVIPGVLSLTYVDNPGIAWSMFMDHPEVLTIATALLMAVLVLFFFTKFVRSGALMIFLMLILGGGLGNLADRVFRGSVVDYLRVEFINFPVFNLADCLVVVGVLLALVWLLVHWFREEKQNLPQHAAAPQAPAHGEKELVEKHSQEDLDD